jgi:hypothetical protein
MFNIANILYLFNKLVAEKYPDLTRDEPSPRDYEMADQLMVMVELLMNSSEVLDADITLCINDYDDGDGNEEYTADLNDSQESYVVGDQSYSYETMQEIVEFANNHSFKAVQHRYRLIKQRSQLRRIRKYVKEFGTKRQKLEKIDQFVFDRFNKIRNSFLPVHDQDLRRLAIAKAKQLMLDKFKGSPFWILNFKRRHQISSRKVTKIITKNHDEDFEEIMKQAKTFVHDANELFPDFSLTHILNSDQSSFNYEKFSTRTLSRVGEKSTTGRIVSSSAFTHSYTIMPTINADGKIVGPVFVCLQEPTGKLGPRVLKSIYKASNIHITCSKSGKLTKSHIQYWAEEVLKPSVEENFLLLLDSWSGQTDCSIFDEIFDDDIECEHLQIPPKTTSHIQPCDKYFFRQWKYLYQRCFDRVAIDQLPIDLRTRDSILKLQSLIHNQLSSKRFIPMIRYAWFSCGYAVQDPGQFENVRDVCFSFDKDICSIVGCGDQTFICCSWCEDVLCFRHFFVEDHKHF